MAEPLFADKAHPPDDARLAAALGPAWPWWQAIRAGIAERHGETVAEWKHYGAASGWTLKTLRKKRNLFFFTPLANSFRIAFVFGDPALAAVERSAVPESIKAELRGARKYAEGRGVRVEVTAASDVAHILALVAIKIAS